MVNVEIKQALKKKGIHQWQLAEVLGINEFSLSRKMRKEFDPKERDIILKIIDEMEVN